MKHYKNQILMLYSSFPASRKQRADQDRAIQQLEGRNLPYYKIDGFDPTYAKARYELFLISGIKGEYPQFFCKDSNDNITYIGDFNRVQDINEDSGLSETIIGAHPLIMTWDRLLDAGYRNQLLVLITGSNIHKKQANDQKSALDLLEMKKIPHAVLDGGDSETKEFRNELFQMSGVRGQYPQIFLADSKGTPQFYVGGYDALVSVNDANGISDTVRGANPELVTWETLMNLDLDFDLGDRGGAASSRSPRNGNDPGSPQSCCVIVNGSRAQ